MAHSNSSLNAFLSCPARYKLSSIDKVQPDGPISPHLTFGTMAHEVLYKAGLLRDCSDTGIIDKGEYMTVIPSEVFGSDLKQYFGIKNWGSYFTNIIKQVAEIERNCLNELEESGEPITIERELKLSLSPDDLAELGYYNLHQPLVGIIDLLMFTKTKAIILDYKFSTQRKTQDDFDLNSQLPLYALFVHKKYDIPLHDIQIGYIDIPKQDFSMPTILSNGTLSRAKSQNVSQEMYEKAVIAIHGPDDPVYNCKKGGYYYDVYNALALNSPAYLSKQYLDFDVYANITDDVIKTAQLVDYMIEHKLPFLRKYDSYSCKSCEYLNKCKPFLGVESR